VKEASSNLLLERLLALAVLATIMGL
jgi:hypothetical protein